MLNNKKMYRLKSAKLGIASLMIGTSLLGASLVAADETTNSSATDVTATNKTTPTAVSPSETALNEIETKSQTPVTTKETPEVGDVVGVESHLSDVDESTETHNDITTTTEKATASVTITSIAAPTEPIGKQAPVTTTNEASFVEESPNATITRHEVVTLKQSPLTSSKKKIQLLSKL